MNVHGARAGHARQAVAEQIEPRAERHRDGHLREGSRDDRVGLALHRAE